ncbi:MAG: extracellular solute-binding protein [Lachnospiraceae bacterium]|nr:extracellular solute-binding protein [Lachnospiraceae bacterium]
MRKKLFAILALVIFLSLIFWGSTRPQGAEDDIMSLFDNKKETIYFWYDDASMSDYINGAAVMFSEKYDVRVLPQLVSESKYLEAINHATLYEEHVPDAYLISNDSLEKAYLTGLAAPVKDVANRMNTVHFPQVALDAVTYKGKQVAYPLYFETSVLLYNETYLKDWAKQQAVREAEAAQGTEEAEGATEMLQDEAALQARADEILKTAVPETIDDILKVADTFDPPENVEGIFKWDVSDIFYNYYFVGNYMDVGGTTGDDPAQLNINNPEVISCLEIYKALNEFFYIESDKVTYESVLQDFMDGKIMFTIVTTDALAILEQAKKAEEFAYDYGVAMLPDIGEKLESRSLSVTGVVAVNGYSKKAELAEQFAVYLSTDYAPRMYERCGRMASYYHVKYANDLFAVFMQEYERSVSLPKMIETGNYWVQLEILFSKVWNGGEVAGLVEELAQKMNEQVQIKD